MNQLARFIKQGCFQLIRSWRQPLGIIVILSQAHCFLRRQADFFGPNLKIFIGMFQGYQGAPLELLRQIITTPQAHKQGIARGKLISRHFYQRRLGRLQQAHSE